MSAEMVRELLDEIGQSPRLDGAGCRTERGRPAMIAYMSRDQGVGPGAAQRARDVCETMCPLATHAACLAWVLTSEQTPGSWGGMYAGLTAHQRNKRFRPMTPEVRRELATSTIRRLAR